MVVAGTARAVGALGADSRGSELVVEPALEEPVQGEHADQADDQADGRQQGQQGDEQPRPQTPCGRAIPAARSRLDVGHDVTRPA
jgi:hypothetical protein